MRGQPRSSSPYATLGHSPNYSFNANGTLSPGSAHSLSFESAGDIQLIVSPTVTVREAFQLIHRPKNLAEKARLTSGSVVS